MMLQLGIAIVAAPPHMQQPLFNRLNGDSTVTMRVFPASEKHGPITDYYVVVVTDELAGHKQPDDFDLAEVHCDVTVLFFYIKQQQLMDMLVECDDDNDSYNLDDSHQSTYI